MDKYGLDRLRRECEAANGNFAQLWAVMTPLAAEWVEIRHEPPQPDLDGWRRRADFTAYVEHEAATFTKAFRDPSIGAEVRIEEGTLVWGPLRLTGEPLLSGERVEIRYRVEMHFADGELVRVVGVPDPRNVKSDVIAWLKSVAAVGGFNPPAAQPQRPA
jgi:hypothetical protein